MEPSISRLPEVRRILSRYALGMAFLAFCLILTNTFCGGPCGARGSFWIAAIGQVTLTALSAWIVFRLLRLDVSTLWTPAVIFPLSTALYFGFGSMSALFADTMTLRFLMAGNYAIDAVGLTRTLLLTSVGVAVTTVAMVFATQLRFGSADARPGADRSISLPATAILFTLCGAILKYGFILPEQFGVINVSVPGSLKALSGLLDLGLATMTFMAVRGRRIWGVVFWVLFPLHLGLSSLEFSKKVIMFAILLPAAGAFLGHRNWRRLIPWLVFAALMFTTFQNINTAARLTFLQRTGTIGSESGFGERFDVVGEILSGNVEIENLSSSARAAAQVWWLRLNYSGAQLRAMELRDRGIYGEWTLSLAQVLVPRFLWPDKPASATQGRDFNRIVSGNSEARTRVGITVYADGYWQGGWPGAVGFSVIMGLIMGIVTRINYLFVIKRQLIYLPMIFYGMRMAALGPLGFLQKSFVAAMPIYLGYLLLVYLMQNMVVGRGSQSRGVRVPA